MKTPQVTKPQPSNTTAALADDAVTLASSPCSLSEADAAYAGYLTRGEVTDLLNMLLEAERAGVKVTARMARKGAAPGAELAAVLRDVSRDEARFCAMLTGHVERLGASASAVTGDFQDKVMALETWTERLALLNRGQGWVARKLREALPQIRDDGLHRDLKDMLEVHERNIEICNRVLKVSGL